MNSENHDLDPPVTHPSYCTSPICCPGNLFFLRIHPYVLALVLANPSSSNQEFVPGFLSLLDSENSFYRQFDTGPSFSHSNCSGPFQKPPVSSCLLCTCDFSFPLSAVPLCLCIDSWNKPHYKPVSQTGNREYF